MTASAKLLSHLRNIDAWHKRPPRNFHPVFRLLDKDQAHFKTIDCRNNVDQIGIVIARITGRFAIL